MQQSAAVRQHHARLIEVFQNISKHHHVVLRTRVNQTFRAPTLETQSRTGKGMLRVADVRFVEVDAEHLIPGAP